MPDNYQKKKTLKTSRIIIINFLNIVCVPFCHKLIYLKSSKLTNSLATSAMPTEANAAPIHQTIPAVVRKQPTKYRHYRPLQTTSNQKQQKNTHQNPNKNSIMLFKQIKSHNSSQMKYKQIATDSYLGEVHRQWRLCINQLISEFQPYLILIAANRNS